MDYKLENLQEAARLEKAKRWDALLEFSKGWSVSEPKNHMAWQAMGDALRKLGRSPEAIIALRKGLEVAPTEPTKILGAIFSAGPLWYRLGHAYSETRQIDLAIHAFKEATRIDPLVAHIWNDLGVVYISKNAYKEAFDAFKRAISLNPNDVVSTKNLGVVYAICGVSEGVEHIHKMLSILDSTAARDFLSQAEEIMRQG